MDASHPPSLKLAPSPFCFAQGYAETGCGGQAGGRANQRRRNGDVHRRGGDNLLRRRNGDG